MRKEHAKQKLKDWAPWAAAAFGGIWGIAGIAMAHEDHKKVKQITEVVDHNARAGNLLRERVSILERQNNALLERALDITEGKTK